MKKILLGTTTLVGAVGLFAGAALAETPKVTVGGYANFEAGYTSQDLDNPNNQPSGGTVVRQRPQAFRDDTMIAFKIDGKNDSGLGYGGEINLLADTSADVQGRGANASKTVVYMDGGWGRFELGSNVGADGTMKVDAASIARATGGINGDWNYFANAADQFLAQAALPLQYGALDSRPAGSGVTVGSVNYTGNHTEENLNKITYYTPRFAGFQMGVSYVPDSVNRGQGYAGTSFNLNGPDRARLAGTVDNVFTGGLSYDNKFGDVGFAAAATGEWGRAATTQYNDLAAWNAGAKLSYMGFSLAGSYGDWGHSQTAKLDRSKSTSYWTAGGAYEYGPFGASVTYLSSQFDCGTNIAPAAGNTANCVGTGKNDFHNVSGGIDYKLAPGLTPYAELTYFNMDDSKFRQNDNRGYVGIIGTQLNF